MFCVSLIFLWHNFIINILVTNEFHFSSIFHFCSLSEDIKIKKRKQQNQRLTQSGIRGQYLLIRLSFSHMHHFGLEYSTYRTMIYDVTFFLFPFSTNNFDRFVWRQMKEMSMNFSRGLARLVYCNFYLAINILWYIKQKILDYFIQK